MQVVVGASPSFRTCTAALLAPSSWTGVDHGLSFVEALVVATCPPEPLPPPVFEAASCASDTGKQVS